VLGLGAWRARAIPDSLGDFDVETLGGDGGVREGMHDGAKKGVVSGILTGAEGGLGHAGARVPLDRSQPGLSIGGLNLRWGPNGDEIFRCEGEKMAVKASP